MTVLATTDENANNTIAGYAPGLILVAVITASAYGLRHIPYVSQLSPMISAIFVGMLFANVVGTHASAASGISLSGKRLLRLAVALLGLQISFAQLSDIGMRGIGFAAFGLGATFLFTLWMGRLLGVNRRLAHLLAAGTSVCGASAIAAANAVTGADDEDVAYAVACITLFGTIAMFLFARSRGIPVWSMFDTIAAGTPVGLGVVRIANFINSELWGRVTDMPWGVVFPNGGPLPRHPSQIYEAILEGLVLFLTLFLFTWPGRKLKKPGFIAGVFVTGYGLCRIFVEFFREPDPQLGYLYGGWLTRGMELSVPMVLIGLWAVWRAVRAAAKNNG